MEDANLNGGPKKNFLPVVVLLIVVVVGGLGYLFMRSVPKDDPMIKENTLETQKTPDMEEPRNTVTIEPSVTSDILNGSEVKTFTIVGGNYSFSLSEIKVKKGDKVKIIFKNVEGMHDWVIDEFNARTPKIQSNQTAEVEFVADKVGTFEYYCSIGSHRANGMKGNLIVE